MEPDEQGHIYILPVNKSLDLDLYITHIGSDDKTHGCQDIPSKIPGYTM